MKRFYRWLMYSLFMLLPCFSTAQSTLYVRLLDNGVSGAAVQQTADSGYIIAGDAIFTMGGFLVKTDSLSNVIWFKSYNHNAGLIFPDVEFKDLLNCNDGNYLVCGTVSNLSGSNLDGLIMKVDASGDTLWSKRVNEPGYNISFNSISRTADSGYVFAGTVYAPVLGLEELYVMKTDSVGNKLWSGKYSGGNNMNAIHKILATPDSGALLLGYSENFPAYDPGAILYKLDKLGHVIWGVRYTLSGPDCISGSDIAFLPNGYLCHLSSAFGAALIRTDLQGNILADTVFTISAPPGCSGYKGSRLKPLSDGNFILTSGSQYDNFILKIDSAFNVLWSDIVPMRVYDVMETAQQDIHIIGGGPLWGVSLNSPDGGLFDNELGIVHTNAAGLTVGCLSNIGLSGANYTIVTNAVSVIEIPLGQSFPVSPSITAHAVVSKDSCVTFTGGVHENAGVLPLKISPNPGQGEFVIENPATGKCTVSVFNNLLQKVISFESAGKELRLNLSGYTEGLYICRLTLTDGRILQGRIVKSK